MLVIWDFNLTPNITGKIKRSEERTQLYFVRVHVFVVSLFAINISK